ncbi:MAG: hypothetical protein HQK61_07675 [Desulfamplus sp.]|nr:hypothetical protein [Desulfamplus sp.]
MALTMKKIDTPKEHISNVIPLNPSTKHMSSNIFPKMEPETSLESFSPKAA